MDSLTFSNSVSETVTERPMFRHQTMALLPLGFFFLSCIVLFSYYKTYDMHVLAGAAFVGLMLTSLVTSHRSGYWDAILKGIASKESVTIFLLLLLIGMFSQMIKVSGLSNGLIWFAQSFQFSAGGFVAFTFIAVCVVATATGSSIGTMFAAFPVFYHTGTALGVDGALLAGAITSGCIFGDNLAPISDTTIASASTQVMKQSGQSADIGGVVRSRFKYAAIAAIISTVVYLVMSPDTPLNYATDTTVITPYNLLMLLPVVVLLIVSKLTQNIFMATSIALVFGCLLGLVTGVFDVSQIFHSDGTLGNHATGFLADGIQSMMGTAVLVVAIFGIMGVIKSAGVVEHITDRLMRSSLCQTPRGFELMSAAVINIVTILFGGVTSATILSVGPIINEAGQRLNIHPYRRANMLDGFANSLAVVIPFFSVFVFIAAALSGLQPDAIAAVFVYPVALFMVLLVSVLTGFGFRSEC